MTLWQVTSVTRVRCVPCALWGCALWLRSRVEGELAGPAFRVGQLVGLTGLSSRPELNGELGKVVAYDKLKDRFKVVVAGKRLGLRASNLVAVESGGEAPEGEAKSEL